MGSGTEQKNWFIHLVVAAGIAYEIYLKVAESLPGRVIAYYKPRKKRRKKSRNAL